jgi:3-dehydrosphinganine reductase
MGQFHISVDFITTVFRASARGSTPFNNFLVDSVYELIGNVCSLLEYGLYSNSTILQIALSIWRRGVDSTVRAHGKEHREYLRGKGFWGSQLEG